MGHASTHVQDHVTPHRFSGVWDKLGIIASTLCLIDCIVLPIVSTILISIQSTVTWAADMQGWLLLIIGTTASMAFYHSLKVHRAYGVVAAAATGLLLLIAGELFEVFGLLKGINWVSLSGSAILIAAHFKNLWMHRGHGHTGGH